MRFAWTDELAERAKRMFLVDGHSASEVARTLNVPSRSAVIGKLARMGVTRGAGALASTKGSTNRRDAAPRPAPAPKAVRVQPSRTPPRRFQRLDRRAS